MGQIVVRGARTHNLKNIDVSLPRDRLVVITGLSGSGKSSFAFDTLYAEGQRRYVESLSAYARQFLSIMAKPDVDSIEGLSPAISIEQKSTSHNPRSTVGTITEIHDYLRLLFARVGQPVCPEHGTTLDAQTISQMVDAIMQYPSGTRLMLLAPVVRDRKGEHQQLLGDLRFKGYVRVRVNGALCDLDELKKLQLRKKHTIEVVVDRFKVRPDIATRLADSLQTAVNLSDGLAVIANLDDPEQAELSFSTRFACPVCGYSIAELEPRMFSFNNPQGACEQCDGLGVEQFFNPDRVIHNPTLSLAEGAVRQWDRRHAYYYQLLSCLADHYGFDLQQAFEDLPEKIKKIILYGSGDEAIEFTFTTDRGKKYSKKEPFEGVISNMQRRYRESESNAVREDLAKYISERPCSICEGSRLRRESRFVFINHQNLTQLSDKPIDQLKQFFDELHFHGQRAMIAEKIVKEIKDRLGFLNAVGLNYLSLARRAETLSGGEAQRIRLASQIGSGLMGVMYILDEPSIGLHQRDNQRLLDTLVRLRDLGNTVIVVEHDFDAIMQADYVLDIGPGAGVHGGQVVAAGTPAQIMQHEQSLTGAYLSGKESIAIPRQRTPINPQKILRITGAQGNNLKNITVDIPSGLMTCITGVSGSGKSTLINDTLYPAAAIALNGATELTPALHESISGLEYFDKVVDIDQSPIGRTPRSNPATYTGLFTPIRDLFAQTTEARSRGYQVGRFSFNVKGGRCEACEGDGVIRVEMHFLADVYVTCDACQGRRYNRETLEIHYKGRSIDDVLNMTVEEACEFFKAVPMVARKLQTLIDVGLSYLRLGQSATTLSGGEAQRVKLARELSKRDTGHTLYILDEPTTGLHFHDIKQLLEVLHRLRDHGNTVVVIEHNLDVIKTADWIIDLGPEGGAGGGEVICAGTPEEVSNHQRSYTGQFLKPILIK